jgi:hypothetical protein
MRTLALCLLIALSLSLIAPTDNSFQPSNDITQCAQNTYVAGTSPQIQTYVVGQLQVIDHSIKLLLSCRTAPRKLAIFGAVISHLLIYSTNKGIISVKLTENRGQLKPYTMSHQILQSANKIQMIPKSP